MTKVIVDIGCFNARTLSLANKLLHRKKEKWFGLMVEPNAHMEKDIHKSLKGTNYVYDHCAISDVDEMGRLYFGKYGFFDRRSPAQKEKCMRSSLRNNEPFVRQHLTDEYQQVPVKKLQTLFKNHGITHVDILKVDTEGNDTRIFSSYDWSVMPDEIITEDHVAVRGKTTSSYFNEQEKSRVQKYAILSSRGYAFQSAKECNSYWKRST